VRWLVNRATVHLGTVTYSIYLIHPMVIVALSPVYSAVQELIPSAVAAMVACAGGTLLVTVAIATVTYRFIERPGINAGRRLSRRLTQPREIAVRGVGAT
jgi:peptidoglycan/LPS O-acetylase OafA/YrhL